MVRNESRFWPITSPLAKGDFSLSETVQSFRVFYKQVESPWYDRLTYSTADSYAWFAMAKYIEKEVGLYVQTNRFQVIYTRLHTLTRLSSAVQVSPESCRTAELKGCK